MVRVTWIVSPRALPWEAIGLTLRQEARERRISTVKPFIETLRVTNPARQSRASVVYSQKGHHFGRPVGTS